MSTHTVVPTVDIAQRRRGPRLDRVVIGILLVVVGLGWMLDQAGMSVPWRVFPAAATIVVGAALLFPSRVATGGRR